MTIMWEWQHVFLQCFFNHAVELFREMGGNLFKEVLLVGVRHSENQHIPLICVAPESGEVRAELFRDLDGQISEERRQHPAWGITYGMPHLEAEKPEVINAQVVRWAIRGRMQGYDQQARVRSICGDRSVVGEYAVVPILQLDATRAAGVPRVTLTGRYGEGVEWSLAEAAAAELLDEATRELSRPRPGRDPRDIFQRSVADILRGAGHRFLEILAGQKRGTIGLSGLFEACNIISSLPYEGSVGRGGMIVAEPGHPDVEVDVQFLEPVPVRRPRWARKALQMASREASLLCSDSSIFGLGRLKQGYDVSGCDAFQIEFRGHYQWEILHGGQVLMRVAYNVPSLPVESMSKEQFTSNLRRVFKAEQALDVESIWRLFVVARQQKHGTMVVVSARASEEAARLHSQALRVQSIVPGSGVASRLMEIDGAVLVGPDGVCHAVGVILDGSETSRGTPERGSRFNSAMRYVETVCKAIPTLAIVVSVDGGVDVIPWLRPRISRRRVQEAIETARAAANALDDDAIQKSMQFLDDVRFYLSQSECEEVNRLLDVFSQWHDSIPWKIKLMPRPFAPHPEMDDSYFVESS